MKPPRLPLVIFGCLLVLGAVLVGLALNPSFQRWALLQAATRTPGLKLAAREVSVGFSTVILRGVQMEKGGMALSFDRLDADISLVALLFQRRLRINQLTASGVMLDVSRFSRARAGAGATAGTAAAPGLLTRAELPLEIFLGDCTFTGRALLPGAPGRPPVAVEFKMTGGGIAPDREGTLSLQATLRDSAPAARVSALKVKFDLMVAETAHRGFSRINLHALIDAEGPRLGAQNRLRLVAELQRTAAGENYTVNIDTLIGGQSAHLLDLRALLPDGQQSFAGEWTLQARRAQIEPFFLGGALPDFTAQGAGRFAFNPATAATTLQGRLTLAADELGAIRPELHALGAVNLQGDFDLAYDGRTVRLNRLDLAVTGTRPVLELHASRAAAFSFSDRRLHIGDGTAGEVLRLRLLGLPVAWLRPFIREFDLSGGGVTGEISLVGDADKLTARTVAPLQVDGITLVRAGRILLTGAAVSVNADAQLTSREITASLKELQLRTAAGDNFSAQAEIALPSGPRAPLGFKARYTADLPTLLAPWLPLGRVQAAGEADFTLRGAALQVRRLSMDTTDAEGRTLFSTVSKRPFELDLAKGRAAAADGGSELLEVKFGRLAVGRLLPAIAGFTVAGEVRQGNFMLSAEGDKLILTALKPLQLADFSLIRLDRTLLAGLALEALPRIEFQGMASVSVRSGDAVLRNASGGSLLSFNAMADRAADGAARATLTMSTDLTALASLPAFARLRPLSQGRAAGEFRATLDRGSGQLEARLTLNGLVLRENNQTLPVANFSLRVTREDNGKITVRAPLLFDHAGLRSDLALAADLTPEPGSGFDLDAKLTGQQVELNDALQLLGVFSTPAAQVYQAVPEEKIRTPAADLRPAWAGLTGRLALEVKALTRGSQWAMTGFTGLVAIEGTRVVLQKFGSTIGDKGRMEAHGELAFTGGGQPYVLLGDFSVTEFDAGAFFKALEPARPPTVEGRFTVGGKITGTGATVRNTLDRTHGSFQLSGRQGIFRGLKRSTDKVSATTKAVELGASVLGSLFGQEKITKAAEKLAGHAYFIDQLAQQLAEIPYDQLSLRLQRDESLNVALEDLSLVAPEIRLLGHGEVTFAEDKPLLEQPLNIEVTMSGRGRTEQLLGKVGVLGDTRDELGYARMKFPVTIGGTLVKPDPAPFFARVAKSKLTDFLTPEN